LAGAALGAGDEIIDLVDKRSQKRLMFRCKGMTERAKSDVAGFAEGFGGAANEALALVTAMGKFCYLFIHIDIDIQKASRILMNDAFLLAIKEVEEASILLEFVLQHRNNLLEAGLDVHGMEVG
jgi:hypothetical protein